VGEIVEVGSNVRDFRAGEIVSGEGHVVCGLCRNCLAGRRHLCAHALGVGVQRAGAFAEYIVLPMSNVWRHSAKVPLEIAAIFDPLGNAVHTALSFPVLGEDVLITGAGPIGIMAAAVVRHAGARYVVVTDVNPARLELARRFGVTAAVVTWGLKCRAARRRFAKCWRTWRTAGRSRCWAFPPAKSRSIGRA
jgi:threonine 3-dehydrogenase